MNPIVYKDFYSDELPLTELEKQGQNKMPNFKGIEHHKPKEQVDHHAHYNQGRIECIDAMEEASKHLTGDEAICTSNIIKYVWRWKHKNGKQDLEKAKWYLDRLISKLP